LRPRAALGDLLEIAAGRGAIRHVGQSELGVALDDRENVVEVVRDAAGERPQRLHFLGLPQLTLHAQPPLFRPVAPFLPRSFPPALPSVSSAFARRNDFSTDCVANLSSKKPPLK